MRDATGKTVGEHAVAWLGIGGKDEPKANDTAVASASQPGAQVAAAATMPTKTLMVLPSVKQPGTATPTAAKKSADAGSGPILTPASLIANETVQPASTAKAGTATPAIVPTVSPYAAAPAATSEETGPATQNGYLVFGGTGSGQSSASAAPANAAPVASAATPAGGKTFASLGTGADTVRHFAPRRDTRFGPGDGAQRSAAESVPRSAAQRPSRAAANPAAADHRPGRAARRQVAGLVRAGSASRPPCSKTRSTIS